LAFLQLGEQQRQHLLGQLELADALPHVLALTESVDALDQALEQLGQQALGATPLRVLARVRSVFVVHSGEVPRPHRSVKHAGVRVSPVAEAAESQYAQTFAASSRRCAKYKENMVSEIPARFRERRSRVLEAIRPGLLLVPSQPVAIRNNDVEHPYRQHSDLWYLARFGEPESALVLSTESEHAFVLFVRERDPEREVWDGLRAGLEGARSVY